MAGSILYFQSGSTNLMTRALIMTMTDPSASPSTWRNTPFMFNWALDSEIHETERKW